ncbi:uncharacterized protein C16orf46 homolog [Pelodytes ibericus]
MASLDNEGLLEKLDSVEEFRCNSGSRSDSKAEKDLVEELVEISDTIFGEDQKSVEWFIGRGWDEAVCGWGTVSPTACLQLKKKALKLKPEGTTDCILCLEMCQVTDSKSGTQEEKSTIDSSPERSDLELSSDNIPPAGECLPSLFTDHCPSTVEVSKTETHCDTVSCAEVFKEEQRKDKVTNSERDAPLTVKEVSSGSVNSVGTSYFNARDPRVLSSPVVLPRLKTSATSGQRDWRMRKDNDIVQQVEKFPSKAQLGSTVSCLMSNNERRHDEPTSDHQREQVKLLKTPFPVASSIPKTPMLDSDHMYWHCSLITQKNIRPSSNRFTAKQNSSQAAVGFLHTRTLQNKHNVRQDLRHLNEAKLRNREKLNSTAMLSNPILPSLIVTRVEIPIIHHRPL